MSVILLETPIKASPEVCYKLSLNVDLHKISTSETGEHIVDGVMQGVMTLGDSVTWRAKHFGIWQTLTTQITSADPYRFFVDEMTQGIFRSMKHEHYFNQSDTRTLMRDIFTFQSPYGIAGKAFNFLILENYLRRFLIKRNETIKEVAESESYRNFV